MRVSGKGKRVFKGRPILAPLLLLLSVVLLHQSCALYPSPAPPPPPLHSPQEVVYCASSCSSSSSSTSFLASLPVLLPRRLRKRLYDGRKRRGRRGDGFVLVHSCSVATLTTTSGGAADRFGDHSRTVCATLPIPSCAKKWRG